MGWVFSLHDEVRDKGARLNCSHMTQTSSAQLQPSPATSSHYRKSLALSPVPGWITPVTHCWTACAVLWKNMFRAEAHSVFQEDYYICSLKLQWLKKKNLTGKKKSNILIVKNRRHFTMFPEPFLSQKLSTWPSLGGVSYFIKQGTNYFPAKATSSIAKHAAVTAAQRKS